MQRFREGAEFQRTGDAETDLAWLETIMPWCVEVEDTGVLDGLVEIKHQLDRVPVGVRIVNARLQEAATPAWYALESDPEWTKTSVFLRFTVAHARLLLEVF